MMSFEDFLKNKEPSLYNSDKRILSPIAAVQLVKEWEKEKRKVLKQIIKQKED